MKITITLVSVFFWFVLGFIGTYIFSSKKKNHEGHYLPNIVIVKNVRSCSNICYHIHHWMWMLIVTVFIIIADNFMISNNKPFSVMTYSNIISLYLGASISEYIRYGNNIFKIEQKCFFNCSVDEIKQ